MENKETPRVVLADKLIKERTFITKDGYKIENTPENPTAIEDYLRRR